MLARRSFLMLLLFLILHPPTNAKEQKKQILPDSVLRAERVLVVIRPDAGEPLTTPAVNRTARENVEKALMKWGRYQLVIDAQTADLIFALRKGHAGGPTIKNSPSDNPPVVSDRIDGAGRLGVGIGRPPDLARPGMGGPGSAGPHVGDEVGPAEDILEVYRGGSEYPLDAPPIWRYQGKDALNEPRVEAVEQFKKALPESEKQHQKKP